jgi:hypothetical protein
MIQLTQTGTRVDLSTAELALCREEFDRRHWLQFPHFVEPELLELLLSRIKLESFTARTDEGIAAEEFLREDFTVALLHLMVNDRKLHEAVEQITHCGRIGCFTGRLYRLVPGAGHFDSWHDDLRDARLVALSVNLSREPYLGGDLQIRNRGSDQILQRVRNAELGQAVLFRLSPDLEHRVSPVEGQITRMAFAGWFRSHPDFQSRAKGSLASLREISIPG